LFSFILVPFSMFSSETPPNTSETQVWKSHSLVAMLHPLYFSHLSAFPSLGPRLPETPYSRKALVLDSLPFTYMIGESPPCLPSHLPRPLLFCKLWCWRNHPGYENAPPLGPRRLWMFPLVPPRVRSRIISFLAVPVNYFIPLPAGLPPKTLLLKPLKDGIVPWTPLFYLTIKAYVTIFYPLFFPPSPGFFILPLS